MRAFFAALVFLSTSVSGCRQSPSGIAVIDMDAIFKNYKESGAIHERLEKEKSEMETRGQKMLDELKKLVKESELLSDEARKERESRIREKSAEIEEYRRAASLAIMSKTNEEYQKIMKDVRMSAEAVARRRGVDLILDSSVVPYSAENLDLTRDLIGDLNMRAQKRVAGKKD